MMNGINDKDCDAQQNKTIYTEMTLLNLETNEKNTPPENSSVLKNKATLKIMLQKHFRHLSSSMRIQNQNIRAFLTELLG